MSSNLRVDSLQVMFGVPFGPEIDIWSSGCILAEVSLTYLPTCVVNQCVPDLTWNFFFSFISFVTNTTKLQHK